MQPRQVKFLNEADRPKDGKPLEFTEWLKSKGHNDFTAFVESGVNRFATEYAAYLATFGEKKPVEITHIQLSSGWTKANLSVDESCCYLGKCSLEGDLFMSIGNNGEINFFKGHLNSSYY